MPATKMMHIRIDEETKARATQTLEAVGLSLSDAVRLFLKRVIAEQGLPFSLKVPNAETRAAIAEGRALAKLPFASAENLFDAIEQDLKRTKD